MRSTGSLPKEPDMAEYKWQPIEPLAEGHRRIDLADIRPLYDSWRAVRQRFERASPDSLQRFRDRLVRSLSIETGILERLYDLDRGTTGALILHGFVEDLVSRSSTNIEPSLLIDILRDQEAAIRLVMDCVANTRPLTQSVIHELHAKGGYPLLPKGHYSSSKRSSGVRYLVSPYRPGVVWDHGGHFLRPHRVV